MMRIPSRQEQGMVGITQDDAECSSNLEAQKTKTKQAAIFAILGIAGAGALGWYLGQNSAYNESRKRSYQTFGTSAW